MGAKDSVGRRARVIFALLPRGFEYCSDCRLKSAGRTKGCIYAETAPQLVPECFEPAYCHSHCARIRSQWIRPCTLSSDCDRACERHTRVIFKTNHTAAYDSDIGNFLDCD